MTIERVIKTYFQLRRGQSEAWKRVNPILRPGEPGYELDTNKLKLGDGVTPYNNLPYLKGECHLTADEKTIILKDDIFSLYGFEEAEEGQVLSKGKDGKVEWVDIASREAMTEQEIKDIIGGTR